MEIIMKFSLCIPMYNEIAIAAGTSKALCESLEAYCEKSGHTYELIFSDDGSKDGCINAVDSKVPLKHGEIIKVRSDVNMGKGAAVRRGALSSSGDVFIYTDCDLAYGTDVVGKAVDIMERGECDLLAGSRAIHPEGYEGYTFIRRFASKTYVFILTAFAGFKLSDSQCGFKAFKGDLAKRIFSLAETNGWAFDFELFMLARRENAKISEIPVKIINHRDSHIRIFSDSIKMVLEIRRIKKRVRALK